MSRQILKNCAISKLTNTLCRVKYSKIAQFENAENLPFQILGNAVFFENVKF
jgi:hypothetical protein